MTKSVELFTKQFDNMGGKRSKPHAKLDGHRENQRRLLDEE